MPNTFTVESNKINHFWLWLILRCTIATIPVNLSENAGSVQTKQTRSAHLFSLQWLAWGVGGRRERLSHVLLGEKEKKSAEYFSELKNYFRKRG